jgi:ankyrin repeat protein
MRLSNQNVIVVCLIAATVLVTVFGERLFDWASGMPRGDELLLAVAGQGTVGDIERALSQGASVDARSEANLTPLMLACDSHYPSVVKALLKRGADPNADAGFGISPMFNAIVADDPEVVALLIDAGAITSHVRYGETLLDLANRVQAERAARVLKDHGVRSAISTD